MQQQANILSSIEFKPLPQEQCKSNTACLEERTNDVGNIKKIRKQAKQSQYDMECTQNVNPKTAQKALQNVPKDQMQIPSEKVLLSKQPARVSQISEKQVKISSGPSDLAFQLTARNSLKTYSNCESKKKSNFQTKNSLQIQISDSPPVQIQTDPKLETPDNKIEISPEGVSRSQSPESQQKMFENIRQSFLENSTDAQESLVNCNNEKLELMEVQQVEITSGSEGKMYALQAALTNYPQIKEMWRQKQIERRNREMQVDQQLYPNMSQKEISLLKLKNFIDEQNFKRKQDFRQTFNEGVHQNPYKPVEDTDDADGINNVKQFFQTIEAQQEQLQADNRIMYEKLHQISEQIKLSNKILLEFIYKSEQQSETQKQQESQSRPCCSIF